MAVVYEADIIFNTRRGIANLKRVEKALDKFQTKLGKVLRSAKGFGRNLFSGFNVTSLTSGLSGLSNIFQSISRFTLAVAGSFITINSEMELLRARLATIEGSVGAGEIAFQRMLELATKMPFSVDAIVDSFAKFKAAGLKDATGWVITLGDAIAAFGGTSENFKLATVAIQQMVGKGVISMEEMRRQFAEQIPTAFKIMAAKAGLSIGELVELISDGKAESTKFLALLKEGLDEEYGGAAARMMDTFHGAVIKVKNEWTKLVLAIGDGNGAFSSLKDVVNAVATALHNFRTSEEGLELINKLSAGIQDIVEGFSDPQALQAFFSNIFREVTRLTTALKPIENTMTRLLRLTDRTYGFYDEGKIKDFGLQMELVTDENYAHFRNRILDIKGLITELREEKKIEIRMRLNREIMEMVHEVNDELNQLANKTVTLKDIDGSNLAASTSTAVDAFTTSVEAGVEKSLDTIHGYMLEIGTELEGLNATIEKYSPAKSYDEQMASIDKILAASAKAGGAGIPGRREEIKLLIEARDLLDEMKAPEGDIVTEEDVNRSKRILDNYLKLTGGGKRATGAAADKLAEYRENYAKSLKAYQDKVPLIDAELKKKERIAEIDAKIVQAAEKQKDALLKLNQEADKVAKNLDNAKKTFETAKLFGDEESITAASEALLRAQQAFEKVKAEMETSLHTKYTEMIAAGTAYGTIVDENTGKTAEWGRSSIENIDLVTAAYDRLHAAALKAATVDPATGGGKIDGARALGGSVNQGSTYLVGERGPELFTAPSSGSIIPNNKLKNAKSDSIDLNITMGGEQVQLSGTRSNVDTFIDVLQREKRIAA